MQLSTWRNKLKTFLAVAVAIDTFDLRQPWEYSKWACFLPPLAAIGLAGGNPGYAVATQDIFLSIRYRADTLFIDLPLAELEGLVASLQLLLVRNYGSIAALTDLNVLTVQNPIRVEEYGDGLADWLVTLTLSVEIHWTPEPETIFNPPLPTPITKIETGLYTEHLHPIPPRTKLPDSHLNPENRDKYGIIRNKR